MMRNPGVTIQELAEVIDQDQVVALRILKLANSPVFRGRATEMIETLRQSYGFWMIHSPVCGVSDTAVPSPKPAPRVHSAA